VSRNGRAPSGGLTESEKGMNADTQAPRREGRSAVAVQVTVHSLTWLVVGNAVGVWLALLLLFPQLGRLSGALTYGRWLPVHFNLQLYGWASLPMVGVLLRLFRPPRGGSGGSWLALSVWSGSLCFGAVSWLAGQSSGKIFLEWRGPARGLLAVALGCLALTLWVGFAAQLKASRKDSSVNSPPVLGKLAKGALLVALSVVPLVMFWVASPAVYPPINPLSGGPTGTSLLGSSLALVGIIFAYPFLVGLKPLDGGQRTRRIGLLLGLHWVGLALLDHGDHSHRDWLQVLSLCSLVVWWPLLRRHLRCFPPLPGGRWWLPAFAGWGGCLILSGVVAFLPGLLEGVKFTNALVAHAHLAMAGMLTCFDVLLLEGLLRQTPLAGLFQRRRPFLLWHGGVLLLVVSLTVLGVLEAARPNFLLGEQGVVDLLYGLRLGGGVAMLAGSAEWLVAALSCPSAEVAVA